MAHKVITKPAITRTSRRTLPQSRTIIPVLLSPQAGQNKYINGVKQSS